MRAISPSLGGRSGEWPCGTVLGLWSLSSGLYQMVMESLLSDIVVFLCSLQRNQRASAAGDGVNSFHQIALVQLKRCDFYYLGYTFGLISSNTLEEVL